MASHLVPTGGNMYGWITHTFTTLGGKCPHNCTYCSVQVRQRWLDSQPYKGDIYLMSERLEESLRKGLVIFRESNNDLFAEDVPNEWIHKILDHCKEYPENEYVLQTKNPTRALEFEPDFPDRCTFGCTIETNRENDLEDAPKRMNRYKAIRKMKDLRPIFVTVEPIMDFDLDELAELLVRLGPNFVNIGENSSHIPIPEPDMDKVDMLMIKLQQAGIKINEQSLKRLRRLRQKAA